MTTQLVLLAAGIALGAVTTALLVWTLVVLRAAEKNNRRVLKKLQDVEVYARRASEKTSQVDRPLASPSQLGAPAQTAQPPRDYGAWRDPAEQVLGTGVDELHGGGVPNASRATAESRSRPVTPVAPLRPVELDGSALVPSRSLAAVGSLMAPEHGGEGQVFVNPEVQIDEFSLVAWAQWFDFGAAPANRFYRTASPALVRWNASSSRGELVRRGVAEAVA